MSTAAVSQAAPHDDATPAADGDIEAALGLPAVVVIAEQAPARRWFSSIRVLNESRRMTDFPFVVLASAAVVSLVFIMSDLMNKRTIHPVRALVFLLSSSYCIAVIKREWSGAAGAEEAAEASRRDRQIRTRAGVLTKEARESLLTYFVFHGPTAEGGSAEGVAAGSAEGKADQPPPQEQEQEQEQERAEGKGIAGTRDLEEISSSVGVGGGGGGGRDWRRQDGGKKSGGENRGVDNSGYGGGKRDDWIAADATNATNADTDSLPASTPAASPGPSSPALSVPFEEKPCPQMGDGDGDGGGGGGVATHVAFAAGVARIGLPKLNGEDQGEGEAQRLEDSAPFDGMDLVVESITAARGATRTVSGNGDGGGDAAGEAAPGIPETTIEIEEQEREAVASPAPAAGDENKGGSDSGEWSTDQSCIVCFGDYCAGDRLCRLPCRHVYHAKCIDEWLDRARLPCCPLCKNDLLASPSDDVNGNDTGITNGNGAGASGRGHGAVAAGADVGGVELTGDNAV